MTFTHNGHTVEQFATFNFLGLQYHQSGSVAHLITPTNCKLRAGGSSAGLQRRHSLLKFSCGNTISLHLHLFHVIVVHVLQFMCEVWGVQDPHVPTAHNTHAALQSLYDYYPTSFSCVLPSTPCKLLLTELSLFLLQVFWWRQTLQIWNTLAILPPVTSTTLFAWTSPDLCLSQECLCYG